MSHYASQLKSKVSIEVFQVIVFFENLCVNYNDMLTMKLSDFDTENKIPMSHPYTYFITNDMTWVGYWI